MEDEIGKLALGRVEFTTCDNTVGDKVTEIEDIGIIKLAPGIVEFTPCDNTLGDKVIEIEDTCTAVDTATNDDVEFSWLIEENKTV